MGDHTVICPKCRGLDETRSCERCGGRQTLRRCASTCAKVRLVSKTPVRCELELGHKGPHHRSITWNDLEAVPTRPRRLFPGQRLPSQAEWEARRSTRRGK